jgi:LDH2 family malate/lactate/ureidoglycolate dehydrogenase
VTTEPTGLTVSRDALERFAADIFVATGMSQTDAQTVATVLVWADLRGMESHGVTRISMYLRLIDAGDLNPKGVIKVATDTAALVLLDADRAAGPIAMTSAMSHAVRKARQAGLGVALVRGTTHTAALGYYTSAAAREGMAAIAMAASTPMMAYHGARAAGVSTSPISIAVPSGGDEPVVLDMATSLASMGKLGQARKTGTPIPAGWALDAHGNPTTDPQAAQISLPIGGPKGSGLALMIEMITSVLVANPILADALTATPAGRRHRQNALALAIDPARFSDPRSFRGEVDRLVASVKRLPRAPDVPEILVPGERGHRTLKARSRDGIPIPPPICDELRRIAERFGVAMVTGRSR